MQSASKTDITRWLHENQYTYGSLALKREDKPNPRQTKQTIKTSSRFAWRTVLVRYLLDVAKIAIACGIGVALGLLFVWAW